MKLNQAIVEQVMEWGRELVEFKRAHATNGVLCAQGYIEGGRDETGRLVPGIGIQDEEKFCLFAMDLAWTFWLDDIIDSHKEVDLDAIIDAMSGPASTAESLGFHTMRQRFIRHVKDESEYQHWIATARRVILAWEIEEHLSARRRPMSYSEYLDNGIFSTAVPHFVSTASLLYGFNVSTRLRTEETVRRLVRHLCIHCRLDNDFHSVEKERREGTLANAVLLLEQLLPKELAYALTADELKGYHRLLEEDATSLGDHDPLARLARVMPATHRILFTTPLGSYMHGETGHNGG